MLEGKRQVRNASQGNVPYLSPGVYGNANGTQAYMPNSPYEMYNAREDGLSIPLPLPPLGFRCVVTRYIERITCFSVNSL